MSLMSSERTLAIVGIVAVAVFVALALGVVYSPALKRFDQGALDELHSHARQSPDCVAVLQFITDLGSTAAITLLSLAGIICLLVLRRWQLALIWLLVLVGAGVLISEIKLVFQRARPVFVDPIAQETTFSFPSGHSAGSMIGYGMLVYCVSQATRGGRGRHLLMALLGLLIFAIGFSRMYLGAHFPSDVLGGFALGLAWLALCIAAVRLAWPKQANPPS